MGKIMSFCVSFYTLQCGNIARLFVNSFTTARPCFQLFCRTAEHRSDSQRSRNVNASGNEG